jgi:hypothetical protein
MKGRSSFNALFSLRSAMPAYSSSLLLALHAATLQLNTGAPCHHSDTIYSHEEAIIPRHYSRFGCWY